MSVNSHSYTEASGQETLSRRKEIFFGLGDGSDEIIKIHVYVTWIKGHQSMAKHTSSSSSNINDSSRLVKLNILENLPSTIALLPHIMSPNQIVELHLFGCDKEISVNFSNLSRLTLTDSLNSLNS